MKYIVINKNDRALKPFVIWLPKPPNKNLIDNVHKKKENQIFQRTEIPPRLIELEAAIKERLEHLEMKSKGTKYRLTKQKLQFEIWTYLKNNSQEYADEIDFIRREQYRLIHGYWVFIDGDPVFINGWYYRYLNYWTLNDNAVPEFRFRDWEWFTAHHYAYTTTENDTYQDMGARTVVGMIYPKHRRDGATHKSLCALYSIIVQSSKGRTAGIQSYNETNAYEHYYEKLTVAFDNMPFFTKPQWAGDSRPKSGLSFTKSTGVIGEFLDSKVSYATTAESKAFDGWQLTALLTDESGKTQNVDVVNRHEVNIQTVSLGDRNHIFGMMFYPSTVAEIEKGGGAAFKSLCDQSRFHERNSVTGQTKSGLLLYFKSSVYGLQGFIDIFGKDIVDDPLEEDLWRIPHPRRNKDGKLIGSRTYLSSKLKELLSEPESYDNQKRLYPMEYLDCFGGLSGGAGFDTIKLKEREGEIMSAEASGQYETRQGNFKWKMPTGDILSSGDFIMRDLHKMKGSTDKATVIWEDDPNGRFVISRLPKRNNLRIYDNYEETWCPTNPDEYIHCGDPFQFLTDAQVKHGNMKSSAAKKKKHKLSEGGIATFWERDISVDPVDKPVTEWESHRFVLDYLNRPPTVEEYGEDFIMAMVFYGGMAFPEVNVKDLWKYIVDRGFNGYLLYMLDSTGKKINTYAGFNSNTGVKQALFSNVKSYVSTHIHREKHLRIIQQFASIDGLADMTNKDLFVAAAGCLYGSTSRIKQFRTPIEEGIDDIFEDLFN